MKKIIILMTILGMSNSFASECNDLLTPFFEVKNSSDTTGISLKTSKMDITKYGLEDNLINRQKFERLYAQCMSPDKNAAKELAHSKINKVFLGMSVATTITGYTQQNWQKPKDMEWFGRLGYSLVFGAVVGKIYSKLVKDNGNRFQYLIKDYLFGRVALLSWSAGASLIFSNDKANREKIEKLKSSKTFDNDMAQLQKYINRDELIERYQKELITHLQNQEEVNLGLGIQEGVDFDHLKPSDLNDPEIQKVVLAAMVAHQYELLDGPLNITGSNNGDFFLYDSIYSIIKIPKDIMVQKLTNQVMCLNLHNPKRGITQAVSINALNLILFADFYGITYNVMKKELIGNSQ